MGFQRYKLIQFNRIAARNVGNASRTNENALNMGIPCVLLGDGSLRKFCIPAVHFPLSNPELGLGCLLFVWAFKPFQSAVCIEGDKSRYPSRPSSLHKGPTPPCIGFVLHPATGCAPLLQNPPLPPSTLGRCCCCSSTSGDRET